jgi:hypothetical protein
MIRRLKSGKYRLYVRKKDPKTGKRRNLGTFDSREAAEKHERAVQFFKKKQSPARLAVDPGTEFHFTLLPVSDKGAISYRW